MLDPTTTRPASAPLFAAAPLTLPALQVVMVAGALLLAVVLTEDSRIYPVAMTLAFLCGGLPHGAFDIHLAVRKASLGVWDAVRFLALYLGLFTAMVAGWHFLPGIALAVFLVSALVHFGEDWPCEPKVSRYALGSAPIAVIALAHPEMVREIFAAMTAEQTALRLEQAFAILGPACLALALIALCRMLVAGRSSARALAFLPLLPALALLPPLVGFALFFCCYHSPRHMAGIRRSLGQLSGRSFAVYGVALTLLALVLGAALLPLILAGGIATAAGGFQLLAALAVPHHVAPRLFETLRRRTS